MHFQFLVEDKSSAVLLDILMKAKIPQSQSLSYGIKFFRGIGGFSMGKKKNAKEIKTGKLLNDLGIYLAGFDKSLQGIEAAVFVVLDNDDRDTCSFRIQLEDLAKEKNITMDHVFCIAVEEVEAWLLGDKKAISLAYPKASLKALSSYVQDSICGTWERLADIVRPGWLKRVRRDSVPYMEIGIEKSKWARTIGIHMCPESNASPSFRYFWREVQKRLPTV